MITIIFLSVVHSSISFAMHQTIVVHEESGQRKEFSI